MNQQAANAVSIGGILRARIEANPSDTAARLELAHYYQHAGFPEVAIEHLRIACDRDPNSSPAHIALAKTLRQENFIQEAVILLRGFSVQHQEDAEVWAWLGVLEDEAGDLKAGEAADRRAIALAPGRDDLQNNLGYSLLEQNRPHEAALAFRAALVINPKSAIARNNLGTALADKPGEAVLNWQSIEGPAAAHSNMAATLIEAGHYTEARTEIRKALDYDPHNPAALSNLALISELDGHPAAIKPTNHQNKLAQAWHKFWYRQQENHAS